MCVVDQRCSWAYDNMRYESMQLCPVIPVVSLSEDERLTLLGDGMKIFDCQGDELPSLGGVSTGPRSACSCTLEADLFASFDVGLDAEDQADDCGIDALAKAVEEVLGQRIVKDGLSTLGAATTWLARIQRIHLVLIPSW